MTYRLLALRTEWFSGTQISHTLTVTGRTPSCGPYHEPATREVHDLLSGQHPDFLGKRDFLGKAGPGNYICTLVRKAILGRAREDWALSLKRKRRNASSWPPLRGFLRLRFRLVRVRRAINAPDRAPLIPPSM